MLAKVLLEGRIERCEVSRVIEPYAATHHVFRAVTGFIQNIEQVANRLLRLRDNAATD